MSIRPMEFNGLMQRSQDVSTVKQQQDNRPIVEQQVIGRAEEVKQNQKSQKVNESDKKDESQTKYDAREKGKNKYFSQEKKKKQQQDRVVNKKQSVGFDIKI